MSYELYNDWIQASKSAPTQFESISSPSLGILLIFSVRLQHSRSGQEAAGAAQRLREAAGSQQQQL